MIYKKSEEALAIVVGTGWNTRKGELLGSVLYTLEEKDRFTRDFFKTLFYFSFFHISCIIIFLIIEF